MKTIFISLMLFLPTFCFAQKHVQLGIDVAKRELKEALAAKTGTNVFYQDIIPDKQAAIAVAEPILFKIYGTKDIVDKRPYEAYLIIGYWVINGTLAEKTVGGCFLIIISAKDGQVIKLTHYK
jgi:hypothetical protein